MIGSQFAGIAFLDLADGTGGRLRYSHTASIDDGQDAGVYRRDLVYVVEYPTTIEQLLPSMLFRGFGVQRRITVRLSVGRQEECFPGRRNKSF